MNKSSVPKQFEDRPRSTDVPLPGSVSTWCNSENGWQAEIHTINGERITGEYRENENDAKYSAWTTYRKMLERLEMNKSSIPELIRNEFLYKSVEDLKREALERDHASLTIPEAESLLHRHMRLEAKDSQVDVFGRTPEQMNKDRKPYLYPNGRVDVEALQELEARVEAIERGCYCYRGLDPESVAQNTREYYEQQIEELSAKWQAAEEKLSEMRTLHSSEANRSDLFFIENKEQADTISELREKLGSRDAVIAQKNRELEQAYKIIKEAAEVENNRPIVADAKLGALVRQMPKHYILFRAINAPAGWMVEGMGLQISRDTPEASLEALLKAKDGD